MKLDFPPGFPHGEEAFKWGKGELVITMFAPSVVFRRARGIMTLEPAHFLCDYLLRYMAKKSAQDPPLRIFADDRLVERATTDYRERMGGWVKEHKRDLAEVHILTDSRLFTMAVAVARLVIGGVLDSSYDLDKFTSAPRRAVETRA
ncbi:MAG TPA: hypothetical protein VM925_21660 [Labilithrix sp.]|nr:hypothetical protein [Labilithrix sp.]